MTIHEDGLAPHVAGRPPAEVRLPPTQPAARTVRCPICRQPAGYSCTAYKQRIGLPLPAYLPRYHRERWEAARKASA